MDRRNNHHNDSSSSSLRAVLARTDSTPATVQSSSRAMMRHYDGDPTVAVNEWRNVLRACADPQLLPLLYVANEVLQTSKRNRGNRFLEAFSPVLGACARYACGRDRSVTEKVRRVIKIWGDRRVFSVRYVGELLAELDGFRNGGGEGGGGARGGGRSSAAGGGGGRKRPKVAPRSPSSRATDDVDDSDDDFLPSSGPSRLQIDPDILERRPTEDDRRRSSTTSASRRGADDAPPSRKRTREDDAANANAANTAPRVYSTATLLDLLRRTEDLDAEFRAARGAVEGCPASHFDADPDSVGDLVGDELSQALDDVRATARTLTARRTAVHRIARERRGLETDAVRFVPFLRDSLRQDDDELEFCDKLEERLRKLGTVIDDCRTVRDRKRAAEEETRRKADEERRRKEEEAERRKSLETAIKEKVNEPGQVYNPATRSYQYVHDHTEDDWRN